MGKSHRPVKRLASRAASVQPSQEVNPPMRRWPVTAYSLIVTGLLVGGAVLGRKVLEGPARPIIYDYEVVNEYWHDPDAFTQGLQYEKLCGAASDPDDKYCREIFWESTGLNGRSSVREVDFKTGKVLRLKKSQPRDFGEGLTRVGDRLLQLNWQTNMVYWYNTRNFNMVEARETQLVDGWGVTYDGKELVVSDGSSRLYVLDPHSLLTLRSVEVKDGEQPVMYLNELEWIGGEVWANVWMTECLARINPDNGHVVGWMLMQGLKQKLATENFPQRERMDVLNGIAYDEANERIFVTGKLWPKLYHVAPKLRTEQPSDTELDNVRQLCIPSRRIW